MDPRTERDKFAALMDRLCTLFDDELERQGLVLANCRAQGEAARVHDVEYLEAQTHALASLMQEAVRAESDRHDVLKEVVDYYGLAVEEQTLSGLISIVPEPWKHRLAEFQIDIRRTIGEVQDVVRENARYMRSSLRLINRGMEAAVGSESRSGGAYTASGTGPGVSELAPALIDAQG